MDKLVSVVIPCYKCEDTIMRAVESVINQSYKNIEIILVEDYSNDDYRTVKKLNEIQKKFDNYDIFIKILDGNEGPSRARNIGWDMAKGYYIAFLDADDSWHANKLSTQLKIMDAYGDIVLSSHGYEVYNSNNKSRGLNANLEDITLRKMLFSNRISTPTVVLKRDIPFRFDQKLRYAEDYKLWIDIVCSGQRVVHIPETLAYGYKEIFGERGLSSKLWEMEKGELSTIRYLKHNKEINVFSCLFFSMYSFLKFIRRVVLVKFR